MEPYVEKVRAHIDARFIELDIRKHGLAEWCNVSESKFEKDFKRAFGFTANQYIKKKKIEKAKELRQNPVYKVADVLGMIGWNYTERSYREAYKKFAVVPQSADARSKEFYVVNDFILFSETKSAFDDILLRLVLYFQLGKVKKHSLNSVEIVVDVKDTVIQFTAPFGFDDKLYLFSRYDHDDDSLRTTVISTRIGDKSNGYVPNTVQPYFSLLNNIYHQCINQIDFDIRKSIRNWHQFIDSEIVSESFMGSVIMKPIINDKIEVDSDSDFIQITNPLIDNLKEQLRMDIKMALQNDFQLDLDRLHKYMKYLENDDYSDIERFVSNELLVVGRKDFKLKTIDLILRVTECPNLYNLQLKNYKYEFPKELLKKVVSKMDSNQIGNLLRAFRESLNSCSDDDQYNPRLILADLIRKVN